MSTATGSFAEVEAHADTAMRAEAQPGTVDLVVLLGQSYENAAPDQLMPVLAMLRQALGENSARALLAYPATDAGATAWNHDGMVLQPYLSSSRLQTFLVQTATAYVSLFEVLRAHSAAGGLLLGAEAHTLQPAAVRAMADAVINGTADLVLARYSVGANEALINAAMLHPVSRALFGIKAQFPLSLDLALSTRMAERMASASQRFTAAAQPEAIVWVASEAAVAGYPVAEVSMGQRELPHPAATDLSSLLNTTASSLFSDVETKAAFWQRVRPPQTLLSLPGAPSSPVTADPVDEAEVAELIDSFRIGYGNLHEIWSLVLPPQSLLGLKRLSTQPVHDFTLSPALWVRIVYDFVLAHRLRTINRTHLLGSLTPLYLAWVASHILQASSNATEDLARAFEADKPYLVSRWRWPDRFNP